MGPFEIREYIEGARSPFAEWFDSLDAVTAARLNKYIQRLAAGKTIIILLGRGSKRRQAADIAVAVERWMRYKQSKN